MFDKLIESNSEAAEFKPRRSYFMVSSVVVGILFATAVVISLYAQDIDIGNHEFEMATLLAPVTTEAPELPEPRQQMQNQQNDADRPTRQANIEQIAQSTLVPTTVSLVPNTQRERPDSAFDIGKYDIDPPSRGVLPTDISPGIGGPLGTSSLNTQSETIEDIKPTEPPPIKVAPKRPISIGVANGIAIHLPKPPYPPSAIAVRAEGNVTVQVTIDEEGKVISSKAVSGNPLLKGAAEKAAWNARFTPTLLSKVPVKVTGVIVYKFSRN